jgi:hypothetical protein
VINIQLNKITVLAIEPSTSSDMVHIWYQSSITQ